MKTPMFWCLTYPLSSKKRADWARGQVNFEGVECSADEGHTRAGRRINELSIVLPGTSIEDVVWTWYTECLVQDHVLQMFKEKGFTGFEVRQVEASFKRSAISAPPALWELVVTGWAGMASAQSGIKLVESCDACGLKVYSGSSNPNRLIDEDQWDGSDFFMVWPLPKFIFVSNHVAQTFGEAKWKGARIVALENLDLTEGFGPGRLSYYMPQRRAKALGEPLGIY
jgi:hypothetical protein